MPLRSICLFFFFVGLLPGCKPKLTSISPVVSVNVKCISLADKSGCGLVFKRKDSHVLIPVIVPDQFYPEAGSTYKLIYQPTNKEIPWGCVARGTPVQVLEYERIKSGVPPPGTGGIKPSHRLCAWTIDPFQIPWMDQVIRLCDPFKITRYKYMDGGAYLFEAASGRFLFDCKGDLLCQLGQAKCLSESFLSDPYVIMVRNNGE